MKIITYHINLIEPVLVTSLSGDPNSAKAFDYLPGSVLRGAMIAKIYGKATNLSLEDPIIKRLFFNGSTRYLNGYLLCNNQRTLPVPLSLQEPKESERENKRIAKDFVIAKKDQAQWKTVSGFFSQLYETEIYVVQPQYHISIHTTRNRRLGCAQNDKNLKPDENPGAVYRYEALAAGQTFVAAICCDKDEDAETINSHLTNNKQIFLGGARTSGYGQAEISNVDIVDSEEWYETDENKYETTKDLLNIDKKPYLSIFFSSDGLLQDEYGQFDVSISTIRNVLISKLSIPASSLLPIKEKTFLRETIVGGFNRKWGLPLPQNTAIKMGSVVVFELTDIDKNLVKLRELEKTGLGERRAEGFGQIIFNLNKTEQITIEDEPIDEGFGINITDPLSRNIAIQITNRMFRRYLDMQILKSTPAPNSIRIEAIHASQISGLRSLIQKELLFETPNPKKIQDYLSKLRITARKQFEQARIGSKSLLNWLEEEAGKVDEANFPLKIDLTNEYVKKVGDVEPEITPNLLAEYLLRHIDSVLAYLAKTKRNN
ncbi:MAG: hypothetical protein HY819_11290 [Acidobacteria bacterium]|nr:hypothetical protein [Acidobacteriota bacterium]